MPPSKPQPPTPHLEIPTFTRPSARRALFLSCAASVSSSNHNSTTPLRIELNAPGSYPQGGLTPSIQDLLDLQADIGSSSSSSAIRVMIRPRGPPPTTTTTTTTTTPASHDFVYTDSEFAAMKEGIRTFRPLLKGEKGDGFVFGVLKEVEEGREGGSRGAVEVDVERCRELVTEADGLRCVFHRAFDEVVDFGGGGEEKEEGEERGWRKGLTDVEACGFDGILTSGGGGTAAGEGNMKVLRGILGSETGLEIIVGGGVRLRNLKGLKEGLLLLGDDDEVRRGRGRVIFHSSCLSSSAAPSAEGGGPVLDEDEVRGMVELLRGKAE